MCWLGFYPGRDAQRYLWLIFQRAAAASQIPAIASLSLSNVQLGQSSFRSTPRLKLFKTSSVLLLLLLRRSIQKRAEKLFFIFIFF